MKNRLRSLSTCLLSALFLCLSQWSHATTTNGLQDPTRPPGAKGVTLTEQTNTLLLNIIFSYPTHRVAIIGGQRVLIGDKVGEYIVTAIDRNTVELSKSKNDTLVLRLLPQVKTDRQ